MSHKTTSERLRLLVTPTLYTVRSSRLCGMKITEIAMFATLSILAACTSVSNQSKQIGSASSIRIDQQFEIDMLESLVAVLPQLLEPLNTTIQYNGTLSGDIERVVGILAERSYGLQRVNADQGKHFLYLSDISSTADKSSDTTRLRLSFGPIELTRSFRVVRQTSETTQSKDILWRGGRGVVATSPLQVAGTRLPIQLVGVELDESLGSSSSGYLGAGRIQYTSSAPIEGGIPTISLITSELVQKVADASFPSGKIGSLYADSFKSGNMSHVTDGAFASIADNYERVGRETVIFPNDSEFLGRPGKLQVKKVFNQFSRNTDLVGIVGCSNGRTKLAVGNEGLALGRAQRIAEEFYSAGLARDQVFNEGCWSSDRDVKGFPNRGVVIDLWRRKV